LQAERELGLEAGTILEKGNGKDSSIDKDD
jgi:hypothetical protein